MFVGLARRASDISGNPGVSGSQAFSGYLPMTAIGKAACGNSPAGQDCPERRALD
jgi:hypothetical protein